MKPRVQENPSIFPCYCPGESTGPIFTRSKSAREHVFPHFHRNTDSRYSGGQKCIYLSVVFTCRSLIPSEVEYFLNMFMAICVSSFMNFPVVSFVCYSTRPFMLTFILGLKQPFIKSLSHFYLPQVADIFPLSFALSMYIKCLFCFPYIIFKFM